MTEAFRITEDGNRRVLETGSDARVNEEYIHPVVDISGQGLLSSNAGFKFLGNSSLESIGALSSTLRFIASGRFAPSEIDAIRLTEDGDIRVTEDGNHRIVRLTQNIAVSNLLAFDTYIPFESTVYWNLDGTWKVAELYVKFNEQWVVPERAYSHINGAWKRIN